MTDFSLSKINEKIVKDSKFIPKLKESISQVIVGQNELIDKILIGMLANKDLINQIILPNNNLRNRFF